MDDKLKPGEFVRRDNNRPSKRMYMEPWPPVFLPEGRPLGPATSVDLLELDAVPEPVDSAAPAAVHRRRRTVTSPSGQHVIPVEDDGTRWDQEP